jgi:predicted ATPase
MSNQPFIRELTLRNFLSYGSQAEPVELQALNVLIGPNAVGKSNLVEAISVLRAATKDLTAPFKDTGIAGWLWKGHGEKKPATVAKIEALLAQPGTDMGLRYQLALTEVAGRTELVDESLENGFPYPFKDEPYFYYRYQGGHPVLNTLTAADDPSLSLEQAREMPRRARSLKREDLLPDQSVLSQKNDAELFPEINYLFRQLGTFAVYRLWDTGQLSPIRTPSLASDPKSHLLDDAGNLALVMNNFLMRGEFRKRILQRLKSFYDRAEDIAFDIYANKVQLVVREEGDILIPASRLSDGTLRYLALLAILYDPTPPPVICIEEPEVGMHPDIIPVIAEMLVEASERTQLIVTTHSDLLVSKLREMPEAILVCDWSESGTTLRRLTTADVEAWPDDVSLGDIWLKGGFGGTRW